MKIEPPDIHLLNAAEGWLGLGNAREAHRELDDIAPAFREHPSVLVVRWAVYAREKNWERALATARSLIRVAPDQPEGWIDQSYCLHEMKRTREAWDQLLPHAKKFGTVSTVPYNLACYDCQMGRMDDAEIWLARAITVAGKEVIVRMALNDSDLAPLREKIEKL